MSLKPLMKALQAFPADKKTFLPLFGKLTLQDLGFYVEDVHAMKFFEDSSYPVARHAFMLENALKQMKFIAGSATEGESAFFPFEWKSRVGEPIGCCTLCEDAHVTLCWFVLPPGAVLPLHDHATMSVWQRVLFGKLKITSVDWALPQGCEPPRDAAAHKAFAAERAKSGGEGVVVFADIVDGNDEPVPESRLLTDIAHFSAENGGGVLHELENVDHDKPALFVDVIAPPYLRPPLDVPCTYYSLHRTGAAPPPGVDRAAPRGVTVPVSKGDRVTLLPRTNYDGPDMNAFAHLTDD